MVGSTIYTDSDGAEVVAGYADLGEFGKNEALDWSIISTVSLAEWSSGFTRTANQSIVFLLASSLIALGIGAAMSLSVVRRIGLLGKATDSLPYTFWLSAGSQSRCGFRSLVNPTSDGYYPVEVRHLPF
jgi:hypothetical protein